ncbi:hypothetical protein VTO42DRAFT_302 [Malbranchea cinnamomea]
MAFHTLVWIAAAVGSSLFLISHLPEYSVNGSLAATCVVAYLFLRAGEAVYWIVLYPAFFTPFKHLPVPPGRSIWNGHHAVMAGEAPGDPSRRWAMEIPNNGLIRYYLMLNFERILVTTPKALSEVLTHKAYDFEKPRDALFFLTKILGKGLVLAEGEVHKAQRRNLNPAFSYRHIKDLYPIFWKKGIEMVEAIEKTIAELPPEQRTFNVGDWAGRVTLDIIGLAAAGQRFNAVADPNNELHQRYKRLTGGGGRSIIRFFFVLFAPKLFYKLVPFGRNKDIMDGSRYIRAFSRKVIQEKKQKMANGEEKDVDIISVALESGLFTEDALVDQVMTFLAAGHETTATSLQWSAYALCKHPDIQARLREEVRSNLPPISGTNAAPITASQIDSLPYLNAFCNEILRYYPPVRISVREAVKDTYIADTFIPKGTVISIVPPAMNRNPEYWGPDADEFNPDRWLGPGKSNNGGATSNYAFLTFLHGPRSCIGAGFSRAELACLVAVLVSRFEFELADPNKELELSTDVTVKPKDGVDVRVRLVE